MNKLEREIRKLTRLLDDRISIEESVIQRVDESMKNVKWIPASPTPPITRYPRNIRKRETCVVHISDTQIGKVTKSYDSPCAARRLKKFATKIAKIAATRRNGAIVDRCVVLIGGDIVEGETIFPHQPWMVDSDLWDQAIKTAPKILADFIIAMLRNFKDVEVYSVPGNHGRSQAKNSGASPRTNFDMIATTIARLMVMNVVKERRLKWDIDHDSFYRVVPMPSNNNILLIHGDQISGGGGLGGYPLTGLARKIAGWSGSIPEDWSSIFLGHFHRPMSGVIQDKMFFGNGTTESDNGWALEVIGDAGRPCQRVVFFDKSHGPVSDSLVWLD